MLFFAIVYVTFAIVITGISIKTTSVVPFFYFSAEINEIKEMIAPPCHFTLLVMPVYSVTNAS